MCVCGAYTGSKVGFFKWCGLYFIFKNYSIKGKLLDLPSCQSAPMEARMAENDKKEDDKKIELKKWEYEQNTRMAERYHDQELNFSKYMNEAAINNANIALRALVLVNGGAAIAVLAFVGSLVSSDVANITSKLSELTAPLIWFAVGVALSPLGMAFAYFTNYSSAVSSINKTRLYIHPYLKDTADSRRWEKIGRWCHIAAVVLAFASLGCFLLGMFDVREAINALHSVAADSTSQEG